MAKSKTGFSCSGCGAIFGQWQGQCPECGEWNTVFETLIDKPNSTRSEKFLGYSGQTLAQIQSMADIHLDETARISSTFSEMDRVLGGGVVPGSVVLLGGDPGIGKSTLLLQVLCQLPQGIGTLYVTGEESLSQVTLRARRLGLPEGNIRLLAETDIERITHISHLEKPRIMVIDSIQTMFLQDISSAPGSVSQVRETAAHLARFAKQTDTMIFLVGHVTKEGGVAGPRILEHIMDAVIFIEGRTDSRFRVMRALKNRFGAVNELGVFAMTESGMKEVKNPSAIFLSRFDNPAPGSVVMVVWEGSRPLLVEIQALMDQAYGGAPKRVAVGMELNRLAMLLAVLHRHGGIPVYDQDVFINIVGGVSVRETSADLALLLALTSSLHSQALPKGLVVFGEVGLSGEIRPVAGGLERLREAIKHGFTHAIIPKANAPKSRIDGLEVIAVQFLSEALTAIRNF
ncbi:MAG: DNA repair protein RadA [Proteobacteria bacterium]|nr:DNA repair protein RadA [Pseudomonadota bacterium]MDE3207790.1 DNA repair protein RadA [Pseudomonadota bacterium]